MYRVNNELPCLNQNTKLEVEDRDVLRKICSAELLFVSVTARRSDIKTLLHLLQKFNTASNDHGRTHIFS